MNSQILEPVEAAPPRSDEVDVPIAIYVCGFRIESSSGIAGFGDNAARPGLRVGVHSIPIHDERIVGAGVASLVRHESLADDDFVLAVTVKVRQEKRVQLRPARVDRVTTPSSPFGPSVRRRLLQPIESEIVRCPPHDVRVPIAVGVVDERWNGGSVEIKLRAPQPFPATRVGWRFEPTARSDDIAASVAVDVTESNAVTRDDLRQRMGDPFTVANLPPRRRPNRIGQDIQRPVPVDVKKASRFHTVGLAHDVLGPEPRALARVFPPGELAAAEVDADDVQGTIAVDVVGQAPEAVEPPVDGFDRTHEAATPVGGFVPPSAADDVESPVEIDVEDRAGTVRRLRIEIVLAEAQLSGVDGD